MHAGVGAASARNFNVFVGNGLDGMLDERLDAQAGALALPAVVRRTVVLQTDCNSHREWA
jgi:hypothetical protein